MPEDEQKWLERAQRCYERGTIPCPYCGQEVNIETWAEKHAPKCKRRVGEK